jgi:peptidoglycan/xylan/chitin deacetylase (PgdA/CDA1 family)
VFFQSTGMLDQNGLLWEHALYWLTRNEESAKQFESLAHDRLADIPEVRNSIGRQLVERLRENVQATRLQELLSHAMEVMDPDGRSRQVAEAIYPSRSDIVRAISAGHEIGSHGHQHYKRVNVTRDIFEADLRKSVDILKSLSGADPKAYSYPFNSYDAHDDEICARYFEQGCILDSARLTRQSPAMWLPRNPWYGPAKNRLRQRRWLLTGTL